MPTVPAATAREVFAAFLRLGLAAFGGPVAHLAYYRRAFVERRRWLDDAQYAHLVALCQFLPGPASSQTAFALGLGRAGWPGAIAAFVAFTAPSALLMLAFALLLPTLGALTGLLTHGLKLVAVAVVGHGLYGMARAALPDARRLLFAGAIAALLASGAAPLAPLAAVAAGAAFGLLACRDAPPLPADHAGWTPSRRTGLRLLLLFAGLLLLALLCPPDAPLPLRAAAAFYRAGALVFGGGHVVLPLLQQLLVEPGLVDADRFLAGYGAAQAVPGPMFTIAAFLGASLPGLPPLPGALLGVLAIFLPGLLLVGGALPYWQALAQLPRAAAALAGVNAALVGLLAAAFYDPVCRSALLAPVDLLIALAALAWLAAGRGALGVVAGCVAAAGLGGLR